MSLDKMILGDNVSFSMDCMKTGLNNNVLVCGSSGCGKTMSITEPRFIETHNTSLIATVTKRRVIEKYKSLFEERGYVVEELNFANPKLSSVAYDPLAYISSHTDITFLAESIVKANHQKERGNLDPYWEDAAVSLLSAEIAYVLMTKVKATFVDVLKLHEKIEFWDNGGQIRTSIDDLFQNVDDKERGYFITNCWKSFRQLPIRTASCVFSTLNTSLDTIFNKEIREMISISNKLKFEKVATEKTVLFVATSAVNTTLSCFVNIFYAQMFKQLFEFAEESKGGKLPIPVHVLCDDFATGSQIMNFTEYISIFREKQLSVTMLIQSESQLESMYGYENATTIINNVDTYLYMGGMDLKTAKHISERLDRPLDEVLYMPIGQEIIFRRGQRPIVTKRYNILQNPVYKTVTTRYENQIERG